jgi:hypothetical protein
MLKYTGKICSEVKNVRKGEIFRHTERIDVFGSVNIWTHRKIKIVRAIHLIIVTKKAHQHNTCNRPGENPV